MHGSMLQNLCSDILRLAVLTRRGQCNALFFPMRTQLDLPLGPSRQPFFQVAEYDHKLRSFSFCRPVEGTHHISKFVVHCIFEYKDKREEESKYSTVFTFFFFQHIDLTHYSNSSQFRHNPSYGVGQDVDPTPPPNPHIRNKENRNNLFQGYIVTTSESLLPVQPNASELVSKQRLLKLWNNNCNIIRVCQQIVIEMLGNGSVYQFLLF